MRKVFLMVVASMMATMNFAQSYVDLGLSVKWATCNLGAVSPEAGGDFYAWGETSPKESYTNENYTCEGSPEVLPLAADAAHVTLKGNWRMPTLEEWQELIGYCNWEWTTRNEVDGYLVTSNVDGFTDQSVFLPAAGFVLSSTVYGVGENGEYWSSSSRASESAWSMSFYAPTFHGMDGGPKSSGKVIRPVLDNSIATALENVDAEPNTTKCFVKGNLVIMRDGVRYNALGVRL